MHFAFGLSSWHISFSLQFISAHVIMAIRRKIELVNKFQSLVTLTRTTFQCKNVHGSRLTSSYSSLHRFQELMRGRLVASVISSYMGVIGADSLWAQDEPSRAARSAVFLKENSKWLTKIHIRLTRVSQVKKVTQISRERKV